MVVDTDRHQTPGGHRSHRRHLGAGDRFSRQCGGSYLFPVCLLLTLRIPGDVNRAFRKNVNKDSGDVNRGFRQKMNRKTARVGIVIHMPE